MKYVFTKRFFRLSARDQVAVAEAALHDIEKEYGRFLDPDDEKRARRQAERIRKKAVEHGVLKGRRLHEPRRNPRGFKTRKERAGHAGPS